jgi:hypothetical protein
MLKKAICMITKYRVTGMKAEKVTETMEVFDFRVDGISLSLNAPIRTIRSLSNIPVTS